MAVKAPSPNYWTARELPTTGFLTFTSKHKESILKLFIYNEQKAPPPPRKRHVSNQDCAYLKTFMYVMRI